MTAVQCKFNKFGFCKFREECHNSHKKEICGVLHCNEQDCDKRHPRPCRFYALYQSCKFGDDCAYLHKDNQRKALESDTAAELENRIAATEERIKGLENLIKLIEVDRKRTAAEERIRKLENIIDQVEPNSDLESDDESIEQLDGACDSSEEEVHAEVEEQTRTKDGDANVIVAPVAEQIVTPVAAEVVSNDDDTSDAESVIDTTIVAAEVVTNALDDLDDEDVGAAAKGVKLGGRVKKGGRRKYVGFWECTECECRVIAEGDAKKHSRVFTHDVKQWHACVECDRMWDVGDDFLEHMAGHHPSWR